MADRVVKVTLQAMVADYKKGMEEAAQKTRDVTSAADKFEAMNDAMDKVGKTALTIGAVFAAGIGVAIKKAADFDQAMSFVEAATHESAENMGLLREAALDAGASTVFSATEAANAIEELGKAGLSTEDILSGGLDGALDLAAAGGLGVADAAGIASTALNMFNLEGSDMAHVADLLAAGAGKAMGDVSDMGQALNQAGLVASKTGLTIEETTAALAAFASQGLLGSDAGTSLKTMLQRLTPQSAEAAEKFAELGISAYDANGQFVGLANFSEQLKSKMADLTPEARNAALSVMFGSDAVRAANVLYEEGAAGIEEWTAKVNDQGYAAETAAMRLDNLAGDWEAFTGALDTAFIQAGSGANNVLREIVQTLTGLVDGFNGLPEWVQQLVVVLGSAVAIVAGVGGAALIAVPKIVAFKEALTALNTSFSKVSLIGGGVTLAIGAIIAAVSALANAHAEAQARAQSYVDSLNPDTLEATATTYEQIADRMVESQDVWDKAFSNRWMSGADAFKALGMNVNDVVKTIGAGGREFNALTREIDDLRTNADGAADALAKKLGVSTGEVKDAAYQASIQLDTENNMIRDGRALIEAKSDAMGDLADKTGESSDASKTAASVYLDEADAIASVDRELKSLLDSFDEQNGKNRDAITQNIAYQETLREVQEHVAEVTSGVEGFGYGLDITTQAGSDNKAMLVKLAEDATRAAQATYLADGNMDAYSASLAAGRQKLIETAIQLGLTAEEAEALANEIYGMPTQHQIDVAANTATARNSLNSIINDFTGRTIMLRVAALNALAVSTVTAAANYDGGLYAGGVKAFADGGFASGIYGGVQGGIHKFAESEMGVPWETYISGRPSARDRNIGIWQETGRRLGVDSSPTISIDGMAITGRLEIGGDGLARIIDGRIASSDAASARTVSQGRRL